MIDASHANSGKLPENQVKVIDDIAAQIEAGERRIVGVMIESHLVAGRQELVAAASSSTARASRTAASTGTIRLACSSGSRARSVRRRGG